MKRGIVSRNDDVYECFPDLAATQSGRLVCVYRESDGHVARQYARLVVRTSDNEAQTWSERSVLVESSANPGPLVYWNCPRLKVLPSGAIWLLCDAANHPESNPEHEWPDVSVHVWQSLDDGLTWTSLGPVFTGGGIPDRPCLLNETDWLLATQSRKRKGSRLFTQIARSTDGGSTWGQPTVIADEESLQLCESSVVALDGHTLVCYMRENSMTGKPAYKCISRDGGLNWQGPCPTLLGGCHRPVAGLLSSGDVLITYRHQPGQPGWNAAGPGGRTTWARNTFAALETRSSALAMSLAGQSVVVLPLDHDANRESDGGYTGWVQLDSGSIMCVNYIKDNAPMAHIRWYRFSTDEF